MSETSQMFFRANAPDFSAPALKGKQRRAHLQKAPLQNHDGVIDAQPLVESYSQWEHNQCTTLPSQAYLVTTGLGRKNRLLGGFFISGIRKVL